MTPAPDHRPLSIIASELSSLNAELQAALIHIERQQCRKEKRKWRQKRYEIRKKKRQDASAIASNGCKKRQDASDAGTWRGITFADMPGKSPDQQRLNLSLLRLRDIPRLTTCYELHGDALKAELDRIKGINRDKSLRAIQNHVP